MRYLEEGENWISDAVPTGPTGGVVWLIVVDMDISGVMAVRPLAWSAEKQVTPGTAPLFMTHAGCDVSIV